MLSKVMSSAFWGKNEAKLVETSSAGIESIAQPVPESDLEDEGDCPKYSFLKKPKTMKFPQISSSENESRPDPDFLSSSSEEDGKLTLSRKPPKKFYEEDKFYLLRNRNELSEGLWDEDENQDNIETLMSRGLEKKELDACSLDGVQAFTSLNYLYGSFPGKNRLNLSDDSNYELLMSSDEDGKQKEEELDHYKQLYIAEDRLLDCHLGKKICETPFPNKYFGLAKILERKDKVRNPKSTRMRQSNLGAVATTSSTRLKDNGSLSDSLTYKKWWKLKEPFPKRDSVDKVFSSTSAFTVESDSSSKIDDSRLGCPSAVNAKCKWLENCAYKSLFKRALRRTKKASALKNEFDFNIDEILDSLFSLRKGSNHTLLTKTINSFVRYKNTVFNRFEGDTEDKPALNEEEIKLWNDILNAVDDFDDDDLLRDSTAAKPAAGVSDRLYKPTPFHKTRRALVEERFRVKKSKDVMWSKANVITNAGKPTEIDKDLLPLAMEKYLKDKEEQRKKREKLKLTQLTKVSETSIHPSYSKLIPPYSNVCKERIRKTTKKYRRIFDKELQSLDEQQIFALAGITLQRMYVIGMPKRKRQPPLLTRKEELRLRQILES